MQSVWGGGEYVSRHGMAFALSLHIGGVLDEKKGRGGDTKNDDTYRTACDYFNHCSWNSLYVWC